MPTQTTSVGNTIVVDTRQSKQQGDKHSKWSVNRQLLPLKMFYFFFYGASGSFIPFITVYLKHLRMSASEAGLITGLSMLVAMLMRAVIGMVADKMSARKTALLICCLGFGTAFFTMWFVPRRAVSRGNSVNSTGDDPDHTYLNNQQQQLYLWVCLTNDGQEICRYPASKNYPTCRIYESKTPGSDAGHQPGDITPTMDNGDDISKYVDAHKDGKVNITDVSNNTSLSTINNKGRSHIYLAQLASGKHFDKTSPCFFVNSEMDKQNTINISRQGLSQQNEYTALSEIIRTEALHRFDYTTISAERLRRANLMPSQINDAVSDISPCLLNCTRQLINGSDDETSDVIMKQPISESAGSKRGLSQSVTADLTFVLSFLLLITGKSLYSACTSLADAVAYTILGPYSLKWGQQRLWGTVGTGVAVLTITLINDSRQVESFTGLFIACMGLVVLACLIGFLKLKADKAPKNKTFSKDLVRLLSSGSVRLFLLKLQFYGVMAGTVQNFTFWFLVDIGSAQITLGVCLILYCVSSVFMLRYSRFVLHKLGHAKIMYVTLIAYAIRYLVLSFLTNAWLALPAEILHGVTYSLFWAAASSTASIVAPPGTQATSQGLAGAMYWDLGRGVGIIVSGQFLQLFGARWTFRVYSMICVGVLPLMWMLDRMWPLPNSESGNLKGGNDQDDKVGAQLLKPDAVNSISLNNNENKLPLDMESIPASRDDLENITSSEKTVGTHACQQNTNINSSERERHVDESSGYVDEESNVQFSSLGTVEIHACKDYTKSGEYNSKELSDSDIQSSQKILNGVSPRDETPAKRELCGTEANRSVPNTSDSHAKLAFIY